MQMMLTGFLLVALALDLCMLVFAATRPDRSRAIYVMALAACLFLYSLGYLLEVNSTTAEAATIALCVENVAIPLIGPCFFLTSLSLFSPARLRRWMVFVVLVYGFGMFCVVFFNNQHWLYYTSIEMNYTTYYYTSLGRGPLYVVQQVVSTSFILSAYVVLFTNFVRGSSKLRRQMMFFILGSLVAFVANVLNFSGALPGGLDPTPFALTIALIFFSINLFQHQLLDIVSVAFNGAVETMDDALIVLDGDWGFVYANRSAKALFPSLSHFSGTELITQAPEWPMELSSKSVLGRISFWSEDENGEKRAYRANVSKMEGARGVLGWSIVVRDNTDTVQMMERLEEMAVTDGLTGIYNRRQFLTMAQREISMAERHGLSATIILFDIDHFKNVNDTYGHQAGDIVLRAVADAVKGQLRSHDLFARYGGEEFVLFCTGAGNDADIAGFARRLRRTVENIAVEYEGRTIRVTASFGVVAVPPGCDFDKVMKTVDGAMYRAKANGRNQVVVGALSSVAQMESVQ